MTAHKVEPKIVRPIGQVALRRLREHIRHVRRCFDAPGARYHDADAAESDRFNRWCFHNLPELAKIHHSPAMIRLASSIFGRPVKPSYSFLSMYGPEGVCPPHTDRPQCQFTIDIQIESDGEWPIVVDEKPYVLTDGDALCYSGTGQPHYRKPMERPCTFMNLAFFHFVPTDWMGPTS